MENHIPNGRQIVLCGDSVFMLAIEAAITTSGSVVTRIPKQPASLARLLALAPDIIIFEQDEDPHVFFCMLAQANVPLIELNPAQQTIQVFGAQQAPLDEIRDVLHSLQKTQPPREV